MAIRRATHSGTQPASPFDGSRCGAAPPAGHVFKTGAHGTGWYPATKKKERGLLAQVDLSGLASKILATREVPQRHAECLIKESGRSPLSQAVLSSLGSLKETVAKILDAADEDLRAEPINHGVMAQRLRDQGWHVGSLLGAVPDATFSQPPKRR